jgi:hypothetical protein
LKQAVPEDMERISAVGAVAVKKIIN